MKRILFFITVLVSSVALSSCGLGQLPMATGRAVMNTGSNLISSASGILN